MKSIVLLSGGLDSTVAMAAEMENSRIMLALTFDYGQKAARREAEAAASIARHYGVRHRLMAVDFLQEITTTSLVDQVKSVPTLTMDQLDDVQITCDTANKVWVPNRNGLFINIAAAFAEAMECEQVVVGFNAEEGTTFPDNTPEFMAATTLALSYSTQKGVKLISPTVHLTKAAMVTLGRQLHIPFHLLWSCYHGGPFMCGACESCLRLKRALQQGGLAETLHFAQ